MANKRHGWIPQQHGAWAMLAAPSLLGAVARIRTHGYDAAVPLMVVAWFVGYFWFSAASLWLKSASRRRREYLPATATYGAAAAVLGVAAVATAGPGLLGWAAIFGPLVLGTLLLVWQRQERSFMSGLLTVVAAAVFCMTLYRPSFPEAIRHWAAADMVAIRWCTLVCLAYFLGTVFSVKSMIRERGSLVWEWLTTGYHLACVGGAVAGLLLGRLHWAWIVFFAVATVRAAAWPLLGRGRSKPIRPAALGVVEIGFSLALIVLVLLVGPLP